MINEFTINFDGLDYLVKVEKKKMKNITIKYENNTFSIHVNSRIYTQKYLEGIVMKFAPKLIANSNNKKYFRENKVFLLGELVNMNEINFENIVFRASSEENFYIKAIPLFKKYVTERTRYYESLMNVPVQHQVEVNLYKTLYGVNYFKKNMLKFNILLIHFSKEAIDSVVVHELAHYFVHSHSSDFYDIVYKYFPNYKEMRRCIIKGFKYDNEN